MKFIAAVFALSLVAGCSSPPKPASCKGEFRPVNQADAAAMTATATDTLAMCPDRKNHEQS